MTAVMKARVTRAVTKINGILERVKNSDESLEGDLLSNDLDRINKAVNSIETFLGEIVSAQKEMDVAQKLWLGYIASLGEEAREKEAEAMERHLDSSDGANEALEAASKHAVLLERLKDRAHQALRELSPIITTPSPTRTTPPLYAAPNPSVPQPFLLPKIPLPRFDGDESKFRLFTQAFDQTIDSQHWPKVVKLAYMFDSLDGRAKQAIAGFELSEENYDLVRTRLKERFGNEQSLRNKIFSQILSLQPYGESYSETVELVDEIEALLQQAETLKMDVEAEAIRLAIERALPRWVESSVFQMKLSSPVWKLGDLRQALARIVKSGAERQHHCKRHERATTMVTTYSKKTRPLEKGQNEFHRKPNLPNTSETQTRTKKAPRKACAYCSEMHASLECRKFANPEARKRHLQATQKCFNCLQEGHNVAKCPSKWTCRKCKKKHHSSICNLPNPSTERNTAAATIDDAPTALACKAPEGVLLMTIQAIVRNPKNNKRVKTSIFFDCGSDFSYVSFDLLELLGIEKAAHQSMDVTTFGGQTKKLPFQAANVELELLDGSTFPLAARGISQITAKLRSIAISNIKPEKLCGHIQTEKRQPHVLLGIDDFWNLVINKRKEKIANLHIIDTKLGVVLSGGDNPLKRNNYGVTAEEENIEEGAICANGISIIDEDSVMQEEVAKWLSLDNIGIEDQRDTKNDDQETYEKFKQSTKFVNNRFLISIPIDENVQLDSNEGLAIQQLIAWTKNASKSPETIPKTKEGFELWKKDGIIEQIPDEEIQNPPGGKCVYNPFHVVTKKFRIVHNGSAARKGRTSLNSHIHRGPVMHMDLVQFLLMFRTAPYVAMGDIKQAFLQLGLNTYDKDLLRFLVPKDWKKPITKENIRHMRFTRLNFGLKCSSFLLAGTLKILFDESDPRNEEVLKGTYVDNMLATGNTADEVKNKIEYTKEKLQEASMELRDLVSNSPSNNKKWRFEKTEYNVLGHTWNIETDSIVFRIPGNEWTTTTKRSLLSNLARFYDPMGYFAPIWLPLKSIIQKTWKLDLKWDQPLPPEIANELIKTNSAIITIPRNVLPTIPGELILHVFTDASLVGIGICAYLKVKDSNHLPHLLMAKSKVTPLGENTVPRLELTAATLGVRKAKTIRKNIPRVQACIIWSDSQVVLGWIRGDAADKPVFVKNRLAEITSIEATFRYVRTHENPADIASRGTEISKIEKNELWWNGPSFLQQPEDQWPRPELEPIEITPTKGTTATSIIQTQEKEDCSLLNPRRFSSWNKMICTMTFVLWFIKITSTRAESGIRSILKNFTHRHEIGQLAEIQLIKESQQRHPPSPTDTKSLRLFRDENNCWRSQGRIDNSNAGEEAKKPFFLSHKDPATALLAADVHERMQHASTSVTLATLRNSVWITHGRVLVNKVVKRCLACKPERAVPFKLPELPQLPTSRVKASLPFENAGVDLAGPFLVNDNGETTKVWICVFVCMASRAIHIETTRSVSAIDFLQALRRFVARRGLPKFFISDNGTNFRATSPLIESWSNADQELFEKSALKDRITWKHIPVLSPWSGGLYERMIRIIKESLRRTIRNRLLDIEEFITFTAEAEAVVNSRPLTNLGNGKVPRPIDLTIPNATIRLPTEELQDSQPLQGNTQRSLRASWQHAVDRTNIFWELFTTDYLLALRERGFQGLKQHPNATKRRPILDEIVIVYEPNVAKGKWRTGKITRLVESNDGHVRSAEVQMSNGRSTIRSIATLYPLEILPEENENTTANEKPESEAEKPTENKDVSKGSQSKNGSAQKIVESSRSRYEFRPRKAITYTTVILVLQLMSGVAASACSGIVRYQEYCTRFGLAIHENKGRACAKPVSCGIDQHIRRHTDPSYLTSPCTTPCRCPNWADDCSWLIKHPSTQYLPEHGERIAKMAPNLCRVKSQQCPIQQTRSIHEVMLYNGAMAWVNELNIIRKQITEPICIGEGDVDGTSTFCEQFKCTRGGPRFCLFPRHELALLQTPNGAVPIKAWATSNKRVYVQEEKNDTTEKCRRLSFNCTNSGLVIDIIPECNDLAEICVNTGSNRQCTHLDPSQISQGPTEFCTPPKYRITNHTFEITAWKNGNLREKRLLQCPPLNICDVSNCIICWSTYFTPQCTVSRVGGALLRVLIGITWFWATIAIVKRATRRQRRQRTYPIRLMRLALLLLLHWPSQVYSCGETITIQAKNHECQVFHNGLTSCRFEQKTMLTLRDHEEACIMFKDHTEKPAGTLRIRAQGSYRCSRTGNRVFTRPVEIHTVSTRRCPGMGSCSSNACATTTHNAKIEEFRQTSHLPGNSRCQDGCSGFICGCISFAPACLFSRSFASPIDNTTIEVINCEWVKSAIVEWDLEGKKGKSILAPGETDKDRTLSIGVINIDVQKEISQRQFAIINQETATALDEVQAKAATLFQCPTQMDAMRMTSQCKIDEQQLACRMVDERIVCGRLTGPDWTSHRLPISIRGDLFQFDDRSKTVTGLAGNTITTLAINIQGMTTTTRVDVARCQLEDLSIKGCFSCDIGAVLDYVCTAEFGQTSGHLLCGNSTTTLVCDGSHSKRQTTINFEESNIDMDCQLSCPGGKTNTQLRGRLFYIEQTRSEWTVMKPEMTDVSVGSASWLQQLLYEFILKDISMIITIIALLFIVPYVIILFCKLFRTLLRCFHLPFLLAGNVRKFFR